MRISDWSSDVCSSDLRIGTRQAAAVADVGEECRISDREPSDAELSPAGAFAQFFEDAIFAAPRLLERILDRVRDAMAVGRGPFALRIVERNAPALDRKSTRLNSSH